MHFYYIENILFKSLFMKSEMHILFLYIADKKVFKTYEIINRCIIG
jgi:hypothetical protein